MWGNEPSHSQRSFHLGSLSPIGLLNVQRASQGPKLSALKSSLYHWKIIETYMSKMGSHDPFGHLKHKLWPKERSGVKLAVWLSTIKSRESTRFTSVQVACDISLESSWQGLQIFSILRFNQRFARKVIRPQSRKSPNFNNFGTPIWESNDKMPFGCGPHGRHIIYYKGEGGGFFQVRAMVNLVSPSCLWLVLTPKMLQLCTNQLIVWFFASLCECLSFFLVPSWNSSTPLYPSKVLQAREHAPVPYSSVIFSLNSHLNPLRSLGAR